MKPSHFLWLGGFVNGGNQTPQLVYIEGYFTRGIVANGCLAKVSTRGV